MERTPVKSSNVESVGYDEETKTLEVQFKGSHKIYKYSEIEPQMYSDLMVSESIGKFVHQNIVKGGFKVDEVDPTPENG